MNLLIKLRNYMARVIGRISELDTTDKTNIVSAINEVDGDIGNVSTLNTTNKDSIVHAIGSGVLSTTNKTDIVSAINEGVTNETKITLHRGGDHLYDYGENDKYAVSEADTELVTEAGISQSLSDQEQVYPVRRVDQEDVTTSYVAYTLATTLIETATHKLSFSIDSDKLFSTNHSRVGFLFDTKGSGYTSVRIVLHDSDDQYLTAVDIPIANVKAGINNWGYVDLVYTLVAGQTYHYHIYMTGYTPGTACTLWTHNVNDLETANFKQMYKPTAGKYGGANEDDILIMYEDAVRSAAIRGSSDDDLAFQGDSIGDNSESVVDIMAVDFTLEDFDTWVYDEYIGVDANTGKIKYPGHATGSTNAMFNAKSLWNESRAGDILKAGDGESIESRLNSLGKTGTKIIEIGDWDMDASISATIVHGISPHTKIRSIEAMIIEDNGTNIYQLNVIVDQSDTTLQGGVYYINADQILLVRLTGGFFDSTDYNATSYNRGWVTITYEK